MGREGAYCREKQGQRAESEGQSESEEGRDRAGGGGGGLGWSRPGWGRPTGALPLIKAPSPLTNSRRRTTSKCWRGRGERGGGAG